MITAASSETKCQPPTDSCTWIEAAARVAPARNALGRTRMLQGQPHVAHHVRCPHRGNEQRFRPRRYHRGGRRAQPPSALCQGDESLRPPPPSQAARGSAAASSTNTMRHQALGRAHVLDPDAAQNQYVFPDAASTASAQP